MALPNRRTPLALLGTALAATACLREPGATDPRGPDPKLGLSTYIEEGRLVALAVSVRAASFRSSERYLPLEVAVANKGLERISLTPESFTLVDAAGRRFAAVGQRELSAGYPNPDLDRRFSEAGALFERRFPAYARMPSNMTPGFDDGVARDHVFLPRFGTMSDFLYFPRPDVDASRDALELVLTSPELREPVFVRFIVGGGRRPGAGGPPRPSPRSGMGPREPAER